MATENFFDRISTGKSENARNASNIFFVFACLCIPGLFVSAIKDDQTLKMEGFESWGFGFIFSIGILMFANDIRNFAYGKKVHLDNNLYYEGNIENTPVRWLSLLIDLLLVGSFCRMAILGYHKLIINLI
jgi:hypothetical protein